ncbi:MAG: O-antigen ligase family protein, partial [Acidobacteriota bacterium]
LGGRYLWIGTAGNPADVAVLLALPALLAVGLAAHAPKRRLPRLAAAGLLIAVIIGTQTISVLLALAAGGAVLAWWRLLPRRRAVAVAGIALLGAGILALTPVGTRAVRAIKDMRSGSWAQAGSWRGAGYSAALSMVASRPLFGVGFGLFESHSYRHLDEQTLAARAQSLHLRTAFGEAHNDLLQYAAETGALGVLLAAAGLVLAFRKGSLAPGPIPDRAALLVTAGTIALLQFPFHLSAVASQWLILAALALPPLPAPPAGPPARERWRFLAVAVITLGSAVIAWQRHAASASVAQAGTLHQTLPSMPASARAPLARAALDRLETRLRWLPGLWQGEVAAGNLALDARQPGRALAHFEAALRIAERPETRFDVGIALLASGEREAAFSHLIGAVKLNPATFAEITDASLSRDLRRRLDADGFGRRHPWIYQGTPAEAER